MTTDTTADSGVATPFDLNHAEFVKEAHTLDQLPLDEGAEIAFAGRSNAGKSSAINALCNRRKLARTSRTPGRTQQFVVYEFGPGQRFIDLPGFGFAKVSKSKRSHWSVEIPRYLETRRSLIGLVLVADARHPLKDQERDIVRWCGEAGLPALLLLNKSDKLKQRESAQALKAAFGLQPDSSLLDVQLFSATERFGVDTVTRRLAGWFAGERVE
jgi:GTP-binding protein